MGATVSTTKPLVKYAPRTIKQKAFVREYMKGGSATQAALKTYNTNSYMTAQGIARDNLKKLDISAIFDKAGLSDDAIAKTLREAMSANNRFNKPDWLPRLKASEMALKVKGHFKERIEHSGTVGVYPILGGASKGKQEIGEGGIGQGREQEGTLPPGGVVE